MRAVGKTISRRDLCVIGGHSHRKRFAQLKVGGPQHGPERHAFGRIYRRLWKPHRLRPWPYGGGYREPDAARITTRVFSHSTSSPSIISPGPTPTFNPSPTPAASTPTPRFSGGATSRDRSATATSSTARETSAFPASPITRATATPRSSVSAGASMSPSVPSLSFGYQQGTSDYSIYGTDTNSTIDFHSFVANSSYSLVGFNFNASFHYSTVESQLPQLYSDQTAEKSNSDTTSYSAGLGHLLPFHGQFSAGATQVGSELRQQRRQL